MKLDAGARCSPKVLGVDGRPALRPTYKHPDRFPYGRRVTCLCSQCWEEYSEDDPPRMPPLPRGY